MPFSKKSLWNTESVQKYSQYKPMVTTLDETTLPLMKPEVKRTKTNQSLYSEYFSVLNVKDTSQQSPLKRKAKLRKWPSEPVVLFMSSGASVIYTDESTGECHQVYELKTGGCVGVSQLLKLAVSNVTSDNCAFRVTIILGRSE